MAANPETDIADFLTSNVHLNHQILYDMGIGPSGKPLAPISPPTKTFKTLSKAVASPADPVQCGPAVDFLQASILEQIRERNMQAYFVQKDVLSRHPKLHKWPAFVQDFIAGPLCGLIAMTEIHRTAPGLDADSVNKIIDKLIWSTRLTHVGLNKAKLIETLPKLQHGIDLVCRHLGLKADSDYVKNFKDRLIALHLDIIDAMAKLTDISNTRPEDEFRHEFQAIVGRLDEKHPCTVMNAAGQRCAYIWPAVWLKPSETAIDAAVQLRAQAEKDALYKNQVFEDSILGTTSWPPSTSGRLTDATSSEMATVGGKIKQFFSRLKGERPIESATSMQFPVSRQDRPSTSYGPLTSAGRKRVGTTH